MGVMDKIGIMSNTSKELFIKFGRQNGKTLSRAAIIKMAEMAGKIREKPTLKPGITAIKVYTEEASSEMYHDKGGK